MKTVSTALAALLNWSGGMNPLPQCDLYTFNLVGGGQLLYTTSDFPVTAADASIWQAPKVDGSGNLWVSGLQWAPFVIDSEESKSTGHWKIGLDSDSWTIKIAPRSVDPVSGDAFPDRIGSAPWLQAALSGVLDYADVIVSRAYFSTMPTWPLPPGGVSPVGTVTIFRGLVGEIDLTTSAAYLMINDYKSLLNQQMPRNVYQGSCRHRLFDARCTLTAATYTKTGVAATGSTRATILGSVAAPGGSGTFALGTLTMTSGANSGFSRLVTAWDGVAAFALLNPFPFTIAPGDTFSVTAGCDKSMATCTAFGNRINFGGEPYIPVPEVSLG